MSRPHLMIQQPTTNTLNIYNHEQNNKMKRKMFWRNKKVFLLFCCCCCYFRQKNLLNKFLRKEFNYEIFFRKLFLKFFYYGKKNEMKFQHFLSN